MPSSDQPDVTPTSAPNWYVLVMGIRPPASPLVLAPGLSLVPLPNPPTIFELAAAGAIGFDAWALVGQVAPRCTVEIESACDSSVMPGYDTLNRAWLAASLLVLRGFGSLLPVACCATSWSKLRGLRERQSAEFLRNLAERGADAAMHGGAASGHRFVGGLLEFHARILTLPTFRSDAPNADDAAWCYSNFDRFNALCADSEPFRFALEAAIDWRYSKDHRAATARLWAGIEALFAVSSELVFRLSVYSAALLHPRGADRTAAYARTKKLYGLRSKAVHGETISESLLISATEGSFDLLRALLLLCIEHGRVPTESDIHRVLFE